MGEEFLCFVGFLLGHLHENSSRRQRVTIHAKRRKFVRHDRMEAGRFEPGANQVCIGGVECPINSPNRHKDNLAEDHPAGKTEKSTQKMRAQDTSTAWTAAFTPLHPRCKRCTKTLGRTAFRTRSSVNAAVRPSAFGSD